MTYDRDKLLGYYTTIRCSADGKVNGANRYATETVGDPRYPLDLLLGIITISLRSMRSVRGLPGLIIE